jgi:uncharacterized membrane protein YkvA (DUF1232 family)
MTMWSKVKAWARQLRQETLTLYYCAQHPGTPTAAKVFALFVAAYALSPIDLIPDFIPVLGYLDEIVLLPILIWFCLKLVPEPVLAHCRTQARERLRVMASQPKSYTGALIVVGVWVLALWIAWWLFRTMRSAAN